MIFKKTRLCNCIAFRVEYEVGFDRPVLPKSAS
jgi:hypothetical protein